MKKSMFAVACLAAAVASADPAWYTQHGNLRPSTLVLTNHEAFVASVVPDAETDPEFSEWSRTNGYVKAEVDPEFAEWTRTNGYVKAETDPKFTEWTGTNTYVKSETDPKFTEWTGTNTYVKSETDPKFTAWAGTNTYVKSETDPVFSSWLLDNTYVKSESDPKFAEWSRTNTYVKSVDFSTNNTALADTIRAIAPESQGPGPGTNATSGVALALAGRLKYDTIATYVLSNATTHSSYLIEFRSSTGTYNANTGYTTYTATTNRLLTKGGTWADDPYLRTPLPRFVHSEYFADEYGSDPWAWSFDAHENIPRYSYSGFWDTRTWDADPLVESYGDDIPPFPLEIGGEPAELSASGGHTAYLWKVSQTTEQTGVETSIGGEHFDLRDGDGNVLDSVAFTSQVAAVSAKAEADVAAERAARIDWAIPRYSGYVDGVTAVYELSNNTAVVRALVASTNQTAVSDGTAGSYDEWKTQASTEVRRTVSGAVGTFTGRLILRRYRYNTGYQWKVCGGIVEDWSDVPDDGQDPVWPTAHESWYTAKWPSSPSTNDSVRDSFPFDATYIDATGVGYIRKVSQLPYIASWRIGDDLAVVDPLTGTVVDRLAMWAAATNDAAAKAAAALNSAKAYANNKVSDLSTSLSGNSVKFYSSAPTGFNQAFDTWSVTGMGLQRVAPGSGIKLSTTSGSYRYLKIEADYADVAKASDAAALASRATAVESDVSDLQAAANALAAGVADVKAHAEATSNRLDEAETATVALAALIDDVDSKPPYASRLYDQMTESALMFCTVTLTPTAPGAYTQDDYYRWTMTFDVNSGVASTWNGAPATKYDAFDVASATSGTYGGTGTAAMSYYWVPSTGKGVFYGTLAGSATARKETAVDQDQMFRTNSTWYVGAATDYGGVAYVWTLTRTGGRQWTGTQYLGGDLVVYDADGTARDSVVRASAITGRVAAAEGAISALAVTSGVHTAGIADLRGDVSALQATNVLFESRLPVSGSYLAGLSVVATNSGTYVASVIVDLSHWATNSVADGTWKYIRYTYPVKYVWRNTSALSAAPTVTATKDVPNVRAGLNCGTTSVSRLTFTFSGSSVVMERWRARSSPLDFGEGSNRTTATPSGSDSRHWVWRENWGDAEP